MRRRHDGIWVLGSALAAGLLAITATTAFADDTTSYPLQKSANRRYLVDQANVPYLMIGDSPQALFVNISEADAETYFADRQALGFNTVWINLICTTYTGGRANGSTIDGTVPFTGTLGGGYYDLGTPNEAYFAHVDRVLALAANHGIQVLLNPAETGGWLSTLLANGTTRCRNYGRYLGNRYRNVNNILWMSGNDFQQWRIPANDAVAREVALGILDNDTRHLHTVQLEYQVSSSLDNAAWASIIGLNATYTYYPTYARLWQDYNRPNFLPNFMVEANYEYEALTGPMTTPQILRKQEYWTMTSGATGQLYGNGYTWKFMSGWRDHLDSPGAIQMGYLKAFFGSRPWYALVPDTSHVVVTSGYGSYSSSGTVAANDMLTAARTPDGQFVVVYTPILRTFTLNMTKLSGPAATRWYDPANGTYTTVAGSPFANSGTRNFTPPGNNVDGDGGWLLVLETQPPETTPPVVDLTQPAPGAVLSDLATFSATASDNVGVVGVQFQVDHQNAGNEVLTPPYTLQWNTLSVANGPHLVSAIARDLAGNHGVDSVQVTVTNGIAPPPVDHLSLAYALDESGGSTIVDASGNGNTATVHNATFTAGWSGNALACDGSGDYAEAPNSASLDIGGTGISIACWVRVNSTESGLDYVIAGKPWNATTMTSPYYQYALEYSNGNNKTVDFLFGDPSGVLHGPYRVSPTPLTWTHVAFTYNGQTVRGYLNGQEALTVADVSSIQARGNSLRLGVDGSYRQYYNGAVDNLRIYSRALTPSEVLSVMQTPVGPVLVDARQPAPRHPTPALALWARNPAASGTKISFTLPAAGEVDLGVFDVAGRLVRAFRGGVLSAGDHSVEWDGTDSGGRAARSGRYFVRLRAGGEEETITLVLLR